MMPMMDKPPKIIILLIWLLGIHYDFITLKDKNINSKLTILNLFPNFEPGMRLIVTYKVWFLLFGLLTFIIINSNVAQTKSNPFEIKPRLKSMNITDTFTPVVVVEGSKPAVLSGVQDTSSNRSVVDTKELVINPFDIDHVPVRKSSISKRTEKLRTQADSTQTSNGFLFWFLLFACALLAIVINTKVKAVGLVSKSIFNENMLKLFHREESTKFSSYLILLYLIYCINLAIFVYLVETNFGGPRGILIFIYILLGVIGLYFVRHTSLGLFGNIFSLSKNTELYSFSIMIFNQFAGMVLIPVNFLFAFGPNSVSDIVLWGGVVILTILLLLRTFRGVFIVSEYLSDRLFQIIIYLCAFEIAPMVIFIKTIMNISS